MSSFFSRLFGSSVKGSNGGANNDAPAGGASDASSGGAESTGEGAKSSRNLAKRSSLSQLRAKQARKPLVRFEWQEGDKELDRLFTELDELGQVRCMVALRGSSRTDENGTHPGHDLTPHHCKGLFSLAVNGRMAHPRRATHPNRGRLWQTLRPS